MSAFPELAGHQYISLTTFRKNGTPVATPVWFADAGDRLYVYTAADSGKAKRLSHTPRVTVAPCTANGTLLGEARDAVARILPPDEGPAANTALNQKYGVAKMMLELMNRLMRLGRPAPERAYLEIRTG
jgi:hypothetical protein